MYVTWPGLNIYGPQVRSADRWYIQPCLNTQDFSYNISPIVTHLRWYDTWNLPFKHSVAISSILPSVYKYLDTVIQHGGLPLFDWTDNPAYMAQSSNLPTSNLCSVRIPDNNTTRAQTHKAAQFLSTMDQRLCGLSFLLSTTNPNN